MAERAAKSAPGTRRFQIVRGGGTPRAGRNGLTYTDLRRAILFAFGIYLVLQFAGALGLLLLVFLLAVVIAAVLNPVVARLQSWGVPRGLSAASVGILFLGLLAALIWFGLPPLARQLLDLAGAVPDLAADLAARLQEVVRRQTGGRIPLPAPDAVASWVLGHAGVLLGYLGGTLRGLITFLTLLIIGVVVVIYTVAQPEPLVGILFAVIPRRHRPAAQATFRQIMEQLSAWALGSLILGVIVGVLVAIGLGLVGMPYVFVFAVLAAAGELVPTVGPIISAIPPVIVALAIDPVRALWVALAFWLVQMLENNLIVPLVMGGRLHFHPVSITFTIIAFGTLFGILGAFLAVPAMIIIKAIYQKFYLERRAGEEAEVRSEVERLTAA